MKRKIGIDFLARSFVAAYVCLFIGVFGRIVLFSKGIALPNWSLLIYPLAGVFVAALTVFFEEFFRRHNRRRAQRTRKALFEKAIKDAPEIELRDRKRWKEIVEINSNPIGLRIIKFTEGWARLMQMLMQKGATLDDCLYEAKDLADMDSTLSGGAFGFAVFVLSETWVHGEELRKWHNSHYLRPGEEDPGGVIDPTRITFPFPL